MEGKKWLAIKVFSVLLHVGLVARGGGGKHRLSPRWNALVDWHSMLRLKGLMYYVDERGVSRGRELCCPWQRLQELQQQLQRCTCNIAFVLHTATLPSVSPPSYYVVTQNSAIWGPTNKWEFLVATMNTVLLGNMKYTALISGNCQW